MINTQLGILTFREWNQNHVKVKFILDGPMEVHSFDKLMYSTTKKEKIENYINFQNRELLRLYKLNFNDIQNEYQKTQEDAGILING